MLFVIHSVKIHSVKIHSVKMLFKTQRQSCRFANMIGRAAKDSGALKCTKTPIFSSNNCKCNKLKATTETLRAIK